MALLGKTQIKALSKLTPVQEQTIKVTKDAKHYPDVRELEMNCPDCGLRLAKVALRIFIIVQAYVDAG